MQPLTIGAHVSLGRDLRETARAAADLGLSCMQIFASSPGAWKAPILTPERGEAFVEVRRQCGIDSLFIHAIYLINLASQNTDLRMRARHSLIATLEAGAWMGATAVITHIGSHAGRGFETVAACVAAELALIVETAEGDVSLALESSAGSGGIIGSTIAEIGELIDRAGGHPRLRIALDTAHLCGSGWDFGSPDAARLLARDVDRYVGMHRFVAMHANDSKVPCGSRKDRHANIGNGYIGEQGFANLLAEPALRGVPWILETPDLDLRPHDVALLQRLASIPEQLESEHET